MRLLTHFAAAILLLSVSAQAREVTLDRIIAEHRITVVTTEKPDSIQRNLLDMGVRNPVITTTTELMINKKNLRDKDSLLFIMDRKKARRLIDLEENLLPCRTAAIDPNEVILFAVRAQGRKGWDILISAPNEKWLKWELERLSKSHLSTLQLQERGTILERFRVKRLCIISNEDRQVAADWVDAQNKPGQDAIDWDFYPADQWDGTIDSGTDQMFILNSETLTAKEKKSTLSYLPKITQEWLADSASKQENSVGKQTIISAQNAKSNVWALFAPSARQLKLALSKYAVLESIPEALERTKLTDLRGYGKMVVIARTALRNNDSENKILDDLAGNLTSVMSSRTGFKCISRQDLKELALETYLNNLPNETSSADLRGKLENATAVAIIDLADVNAQTSYTANAPQCRTAVLPPFSESKPSPPHEPHPDDKPLFCAHTYDVVNGSRANDPHYIRDHNEYVNEKLPNYRRELRRWEERSQAYERRRRDHDMEWIVSITKAQRTKVTGNLRIYDLSSGEVEQVGKVVFSCPVTGNGEKDSLEQEDRVVVRGEESRPQSLIAPESTEDVSDHVVITDALREVCTAAVNELMNNALLPIDISPTVAK